MGLPTTLASLLPQILSAKRIGLFLHAQDVEYLNEFSAAGEAIPQNDSLFVIGTVGWDRPLQETGSNAYAAAGFQLHDLDLHFPQGEMTLVAGKFGSGKTLLLLAMLGEAHVINGKLSYAVSPILDPACKDNGDWNSVENGVAYVPQASPASVLWWCADCTIRPHGFRVSPSGEFA